MAPADPDGRRRSGGIRILRWQTAITASTLLAANAIATQFLGAARGSSLSFSLPTVASWVLAIALLWRNRFYPAWKIAALFFAATVVDVALADFHQSAIQAALLLLVMLLVVVGFSRRTPRYDFRKLSPPQLVAQLALQDVFSLVTGLFFGLLVQALANSPGPTVECGFVVGMSVASAMMVRRAASTVLV